MKHLLLPGVLLLTLLDLSPGQVASLECPPGLPGGNGSSGVMFDVVNIGSVTITLQDLDQVYAAEYEDVTSEVWLRSGGIQGDTANTSGQWNLVATSFVPETMGMGTADGLCVDLAAHPEATLAPGQRVGVYVTSSSTQGALVSYSNGSGTPEVTEACSDANVRITEGYGVPNRFLGSFGPRKNNFVLYYNFTGASGSPRNQVNQPEATLEVNGEIGTACIQAVAETCAGQLGTLALASTLPAGTLFDVGVGFGRALVPGVPIPGGQVVNLNLFGIAAPLWLSTGQMSALPPLAPLIWDGNGLSLAWIIGGSDWTHAQGYFLSPSGLAPVFLTAPTELYVDPEFGAGPLLIGDDDYREICRSATFYGVAYDRFFVNSNGSVSFDTESLDFTPTIGEFRSGPPRVAGLWTDLEPNVAGVVSVAFTTFTSTITFDQVQEWGVPGSASTFRMELSIAGRAFIDAYAPSSTHGTDSLVGFSPGGGATNPGPIAIASLVGAGPQPMNPTDAVYQLSILGAPAGGWLGFELSPNATSFEVF